MEVELSSVANTVQSRQAQFNMTPAEADVVCASDTAKHQDAHAHMTPIQCLTASCL